MLHRTEYDENSIEIIVAALLFSVFFLILTSTVKLMYGQLDVIVSFWEGLREFWAARTLFERIFLGGTLFFIFAGFTGLDGGEAKRLNEIPLEEAKSPNNPRVFFDIEIDGQKAGRIVMELFANHVPRTAENFVSKKKE